MWGSRKRPALVTWLLAGGAAPVVIVLRYKCDGTHGRSPLNNRYGTGAGLSHNHYVVRAWMSMRGSSHLNVRYKKVIMYSTPCIW